MRRDYYRLSADRRLLFGGTCNYSGRDPSNIEAYIRPRLLRIYPQLEKVRIDFEWGGKIGIVLNRVPTVGLIEGNVYYCQGSTPGMASTHTRDGRKHGRCDCGRDGTIRPVRDHKARSPAGINAG